ncbi:MAG TPA: ABC-2 family transporter protein [Actinomycetota bacterium]|jgi:ABC-2 type transport system permease protein|nr:ABC-2 family transporter protein [Actinomycetota bacterium]
MRLWLEVAVRGFRRYATYRGATLAGVFTNTAFGFFTAYVYIAVFRMVPHIGGFDLRDVLTYNFVVQGMIMPLYVWGWMELAETVRTGQVATDLYRPIDYQFYWLSQDLGRAFYHATLRGIGPFVIGALAFSLRLPTEPYTWLAFAVSFVLAVSVSFALRFMVNLSAFWLLEIRGVLTIAQASWTLLSGFLVPLAFFPDGIREIVLKLPFAAMIAVPADVFLERVTGADVVAALGFQFAWVVILLGMGRLLLAAATRKLVVQGG